MQLFGPLNVSKMAKKKPKTKKAKMVVLKLKNMNYGKYYPNSIVWEPPGGFHGPLRGAPREYWVQAYSKYDDVKAWKAIVVKKGLVALCLKDTEGYMQNPKWGF